MKALACTLGSPLPCTLLGSMALISVTSLWNMSLVTRVSSKGREVGWQCSWPVRGMMDAGPCTAGFVIHSVLLTASSPMSYEVDMSLDHIT